MVCFFDNSFIHSLNKGKWLKLYMIFLKDLDYICSLGFCIAKQSTIKVIIQAWIPLQPNLNVLTRLTFLFYFLLITLLLWLQFFFGLLCSFLWFNYWEVLDLDRKRKKIQLLRNVLQQFRFIFFKSEKSKVIQISTIAVQSVCLFFFFFFTISIFNFFNVSYY